MRKRKKLLILAVGTEASGAARMAKEQIHAHPESELEVMVRYIDTDWLPNYDRTLHSTEWFHLQINPNYMRDLLPQIERYPRIHNLLFQGLLPATDIAGGGAIRYNGAGAVEMQREKLRIWLSESMRALKSYGDGQATISIALVISSVGATGSGSLEHLLDVVVDAAGSAEVRSTDQDTTIDCNVYILQPGEGLTGVGLANALALYAELAATQLSQKPTGHRHYRGRTMMVGWGSNISLKSKEHLKEAAATIIRLTNDPVTQFPARFMASQSNHHVLRELDPLSQLPSHLSLATMVTINTGTLVEQVIERDLSRLIKTV
ncbi:MAG TPA: hypothetical protein VKX46_02365, partial [Ktedonobacteraceae bacterium]|nr:hypothetical protein [Ktedonobacteraceae bacterium]